MENMLLYFLLTFLLLWNSKPYTILYVASFFNQKKKLKKPKESASFHLNALQSQRDGERRRSGGGERGGDQFKWHQIRGAPELLSLISNQGGVGLPWQCGQDRKHRWSKARWRGMQHLGCLQFSSKSLLRGDNRRFSKCFTASLLFPTHHGFNSKAAQVISMHLISASLQDYLIQVYLMTGQILKWACMRISLVLYFSFHLTCFLRRQMSDRWRKEHYSEDKLIYRNYTM